MIRRVLPLTAALFGVAVLVAGCGTRPAASRSPTAAGPTPTPPAVTPLTTPTPTAAEVARSTLSGGTVTVSAGAMPATGQLAVDVACWGADGSAMAWRLEAGDGTPLGLSGTADCSGPPTTSWLGVTAEQRPATVRVVLTPASGVVDGYAIVRRGTP